MKKINYLDIMKNTFSWYKKDFLKYIKMSAYISIISILINILPKLIFNFESTLLTIVTGMLNLVFLVFLIYNYVRCYCAMINNTANCISNNELSYKDSFMYAKRLIPKYLYAVLFVVAILSIPIILMFLVYSLVLNEVIKWVTLLMLVLLFVFLLVRYYFIIYLRTLEPDTKNYLTKVTSLLNKNYFQYFYIILTVNIYTILYSIFSYILNSNGGISTIYSVLVNVIYYSVNIFVLPIIIIANVLIYHKLVAK